MRKFQFLIVVAFVFVAPAIIAGVVSAQNILFLPVTPPITSPITPPISPTPKPTVKPTPKPTPIPVVKPTGGKYIIPPMPTPEVK